mgnify:CR=1 FL=1
MLFLSDDRRRDAEHPFEALRSDPLGLGLLGERDILIDEAPIGADDRFGLVEKPGFLAAHDDLILGMIAGRFGLGQFLMAGPRGRSDLLEFGLGRLERGRGFVRGAPRLGDRLGGTDSSKAFSEEIIMIRNT